MKVELAGIGLDSPKKGFAGDPLFHEVLGLSKSPLSLSHDWRGPFKGIRQRSAASAARAANAVRSI